MTLVDSNILIDIMTKDAAWFEWSAGALERCAARGALIINEVVFAELAVRGAGVEALQRDLKTLQVPLEPTPMAALCLAGQVFARYRASGGTRASLLPDFFIGAFAQNAGLPILTRDTRRYRTYFPKVQLIAP